MESWLLLAATVTALGLGGDIPVLLLYNKDRGNVRIDGHSLGTVQK